MNHSPCFCRITRMAIKPLILTLFLIALAGCRKNNVTEIDSLIVKDTIFYSPDSNKAFTGTAIACHTNGLPKMEVEMRNGKPHGNLTYWYENGQKKEVQKYHEGIKLGKEVSWDEHGRKTSEMEYLEGNGNYRAIRYREDGRKEMVVEYRNDKPHGKWIFWHKNGKKEEEFDNRDGKRHGKQTVWYENGQKKEESMFQDGLLQGKARLWDEKGTLRGEIDFADGEEVAHVEYDADGNKLDFLPVASGESTISHEGVYRFSKSGLSVPRQIDTLKLVKVTDRNSNGSNVSLEYYDPEKWVDLSIHVYQSPPDTKGPFLTIDADGRRVLEDGEGVKDPRGAGYKLTEPSKSYTDEYLRTLKSISENRGYELKTESRFMADPKWNASPIALSAYLAKMESIEGQDVRFLWKTYLYSIPGYFVKIHFIFPEPLWLEIGPVDVNFIQSINWTELFPKQPID